MFLGFPGGSVIKNLPPNAGDARDAGSIPGWGRAPGGGNSNPLQYSFLRNSTDRGGWWATVCGVAKSQTQLSDCVCVRGLVSITFVLHVSSILVHKYSRNAARCFVWRRCVEILCGNWLSYVSGPHSAWYSMETQQVNWKGSEGSHSSCWLLPLPSGPHQSHCQAMLSTALIFACLFLVASSQQCSFLVPFLLASLGRSPQWFLPKLGGELPVTVYIMYKVANIRPGISYPALNIGQVVTHTPSEVQGYHWTQNQCAYLKLKCICSFQNSVSPFQDREGPGNGMSLLVSSRQGLQGKNLAVASLFS